MGSSVRLRSLGISAQLSGLTFTTQDLLQENVDMPTPCVLTCLGLGSIHDSTTAQYQFAVLQHIRMLVSVSWLVLSRL